MSKKFCYCKVGKAIPLLAEVEKKTIIVIATLRKINN
jgi:hypothetical protein